jgi:hypothetical protein
LKREGRKKKKKKKKRKKKRKKQEPELRDSKASGRRISGDDEKTPCTPYVCTPPPNKTPNPDAAVGWGVM